MTRWVAIVWLSIWLAIHEGHIFRLLRDRRAEEGPRRDEILTVAVTFGLFLIALSIATGAWGVP